MRHESNPSRNAAKHEKVAFAPQYLIVFWCRNKADRLSNLHMGLLVLDC
jgi:hypothetical protein